MLGKVGYFFISAICMSVDRKRTTWVTNVDLNNTVKYDRIDAFVVNNVHVYNFQNTCNRDFNASNRE